MYRPLLTFRSTFRGIPPGRALITEQKKKHPLQPDKKSGQQYTHRRGECNIRRSYTLVFFFLFFFLDRIHLRNDCRRRRRRSVNLSENVEAPLAATEQRMC